MLKMIIIIVFPHENSSFLIEFRFVQEEYMGRALGDQDAH